MDEATARRYAQVEALAEAIMQRLAGEVEKLGLALELGRPGAARYRLEQDPADGAYSLTGEWRDAQGYKQGALLFHADGTFYVEHDVVRAHPGKPHWFVEAVHAWGKGGEIRAEPRLLILPE